MIRKKLLKMAAIVMGVTVVLGGTSAFSASAASVSSEIPRIISSETYELYQQLGFSDYEIQTIAESSRPISDYNVYIYTSGLSVNSNNSSNSAEYELLFSLDYCRIMGEDYPLKFMGMSPGLYQEEISGQWSTLFAKCSFTLTTSNQTRLCTLKFKGDETISDSIRATYNTLITNELMMYSPKYNSLKKDTVSLSNYTDNFSHVLWGLGDVNNDGVISVADTQIIARYLAADSTIILSEEMREIADVNHDNKITMDDFMIITKYLNNQINSFY